MAESTHLYISIYKKRNDNNKKNITILLPYNKILQNEMEITVNKYCFARFENLSFKCKNATGISPPYY